MKKFIFLLLAALFSLSALTGCGSGGSTTSAGGNESAAASVSAQDAAEPQQEADTGDAADEAAEAAGVTYPIEVESDVGTTVIEDEVNAIAVFDLGMLDILDTLGYGDRVVAVTHGVTFPEYLAEYEGDMYIDLGGFKVWDSEALSNSNPDLIIAGFRQNKEIETVQAIAPTIYFGEASEDGGSHLEVLDRRIRAIAAIFGDVEEAEAYLTEIHEKAEKIKAYTSENQVTFINVTVENGGLSTGGGSGNAFLSNDLGLTNLYESTGDEQERGAGGGPGGEGGARGGGAEGEAAGADAAGRGEGGGEDAAGRGEGGPRGGAEGEGAEEGEGRGEGEDTSAQTAETVAYVAEKNPAYLFVFDKDAAEREEGQPTAQEVIEGAGLEDTDAYKNGNIVYLDDTVWYSASGGLKATIEQLDTLMALFGLS